MKENSGTNMTLAVSTVVMNRVAAIHASLKINTKLEPEAMPPPKGFASRYFPSNWGLFSKLLTFSFISITNQQGL